MNKARRHELKMLKYKQRIKKWGLSHLPASCLYAFRSHGAPCSCYACKQPEYAYNRPKVKREIMDTETV